MSDPKAPMEEETKPHSCVVSWTADTALDDQNKWLMFIGWNTKEHHQKYAASLRRTSRSWEISQHTSSLRRGKYAQQGFQYGENCMAEVTLGKNMKESNVVNSHQILCFSFGQMLIEPLKGWISHWMANI